jgi:small subunit ribosomal protein S9
MERARTISKSMMSYLKRAREHKEFLLRETKEFERGKRHLANMMGVQPQEMTQADIDDAIKYLFPSGLFDKRARPMMKHPDLLYMAQKDAQFDIEGRPHHYLFYTAKPNYYESLSTLAQHIRDLNKYEDERLAEGILNPPDDGRAIVSNREWLSAEEMGAKFLEPLSEHEHEYMVKCLIHLSKHPYSSRVRTFLEEFSKPLPERSLQLELPEIVRDAQTGLVYTELVERHREHRVKVKTILNGTGKVEIDGNDILCIPEPYMRQAIFHPLRITKMQDKVDIYANIVHQPQKLGWGAITHCIRTAVSLSVAAYVDPETRERLRLSGLLTRDTRLRERKKFGQEGARRKYTWKKR